MVLDLEYIVLSQGKSLRNYINNVPLIHKQTSIASNQTDCQDRLQGKMIGD